MFTGEFKSKIDIIWDTMWSNGNTSLFSIIEQLAVNGVLQASTQYEPLFSDLPRAGRKSYSLAIKA